MLATFQVNSFSQVYSYSIPANEAILLDDHVEILGGFQSGTTYTADFSGNPVMPMQGAFVMYVDQSTGHTFTYVPLGDQLTFTPGSGSYKFAPFLVDWSTLGDNSGSVIVDLSDGRQITLLANEAILLDDYPQFPILGGFNANQTYYAYISGNPQMPMQGVFVMYVDQVTGHTFTYVPLGGQLSFTPGAGTYKFCAFQVDWSTVGDNSGETLIEIYEEPISVEEENLNLTYSLSQNYPNPFNPTTKIKYSVPTESFVSLKVYDILGSEISTLVNDNIKAGFYDVQFNGDNLPSGIYLYRLQAGNFVETKKMLLIK